MCNTRLRNGSLLASTLLLASPALAQQPDTVALAVADTTRYYPATDEHRVESEIDSAGACTELLRWGPHRGLLRSYFASGHLHSYVPYGDVEEGVRHGHVSSWYDNGQARSIEPFEQGKRQGTMLVYYEDGRLKRRSDYQAGVELPGECYDPAGQPVAYFPYEQPPLYPGGAEQLLHEVNRRLRRLAVPMTAAALVPSYVQISFLVTEAGRVSESRIEAASLLPTFDRAALAAVNQLSRAWVPGQLDGQPTRYTYRLRLPVGGMARPATLRRW